MQPESFLLPDLADWPASTYRSTEEAISVLEYFVRYTRRRWPAQPVEKQAPARLWIEYLEIIFCSPQEAVCKQVRLLFGGSVLQLRIPDKGYTPQEKESLRDYYLERYAPLVQECQSRTCAFLWRVMEAEERSLIRRGFYQGDTIQEQVLHEMKASREAAVHEAYKEATTLDIQTERSSTE